MTDVKKVVIVKPQIFKAGEHIVVIVNSTGSIPDIISDKNVYVFGNGVEKVSVNAIVCDSLVLCGVQLVVSKRFYVRRDIRVNDQASFAGRGAIIHVPKCYRVNNDILTKIKTRLIKKKKQDLVGYGGIR